MAGVQGVEVRVLEADALSHGADVLVLKHAQGSHGLDAVAKQIVGVDDDLDLPPGTYKLISNPPGIASANIVFLGVVRLQKFGYEEIREFAHRALATVAREVPGAREIALTLHGAGYGLDEIACFDAELLGVFDAADAGEAPPALEQVTIVEREPGRALRIWERLDGILAASEAAGGALPERSVATPSTKGGSQLIASTPRDHAFVAMPFSEEFEDVFHYGIAAAVRECGLLCERIDQVVFTGDILNRMKERIRTASLVVADLTGANANVYLEVGFAWASGVPTVLVHHKDSELTFDVRGEKCLRYGSIKELESSLSHELSQLVAR